VKHDIPRKTTGEMRREGVMSDVEEAAVLRKKKS
jgi:hypothetical protein